MRIVLLIGLLVATAACTLRTREPEVEVRAPAVRVLVGDGPGRFCPPGQAKKGAC